MEDRKLRRLGSKVETAVDVCVLAATNRIPDEAVVRGELRNDLYYRLNVFNIHMPPLREHKEDIAGLVQLLLAEMNEKHGQKVTAVSEAVLNQFYNYAWPGNVRELRNTIERAEHAWVRPDQAERGGAPHDLSKVCQNAGTIHAAPEIQALSGCNEPSASKADSLTADAGGELR